MASEKTEKKTTARKPKETAPAVEEVTAQTATPAEKTYTEREVVDLVSGLQQQIEALKA